jgi:methylamine--corrinoid protein Co-methyltransferase
VISLLEVADRAYTGPKMEEKAWNLGLFRKTRELIERFQLGHSGPDRYFAVADEEVDRFFDAGVALLAELGVYCFTTNRVIPLTTDEVLTAARSASEAIAAGVGGDRRVIRKRRLEDPQVVNFHMGGHCPWPQERAAALMAAFASVRRNDYIEGFNLTTIDGYEVRGDALAAYASRRTIEIMLEAVGRAGRPGMAIAFYPILTRAGCMLAPLDPDTALRRSDGVLLSTQRDLKVEDNFIQTAIILERYGGFRLNGGTSSVIGGFCGPLEGAMLETIAKHLVGWICYRDHFSYGPNVQTQAELLAGRSPQLRVQPADLPPNGVTYVIARAIQRNTNLIVFGSGFHGEPGAGGAGSVTSLLALARNTIATTVLGSNVSGGFTPYHGEWLVQVADATVKARLKGDEVQGMMERIDAVIREKRGEEATPSTGAFVGDQRMLAYRLGFDEYLKPLTALYDVDRQMPKDRLVQTVGVASRILADLGIDVETAAH